MYSSGYTTNFRRRCNIINCAKMIDQSSTFLRIRSNVERLLKFLTHLWRRSKIAWTWNIDKIFNQLSTSLRRRRFFKHFNQFWALQVRRKLVAQIGVSLECRCESPFDRYPLNPRSIGNISQNPVFKSKSIASINLTIHLSYKYALKL